MKILVIDNYDSFTYNVVDYFGSLGATVEVRRNDVSGPFDADALVISPGPGAPAASGASRAVVGWCERTRTPLLGVCLGHQVIAEHYGARIVRAPSVMHGKTSLVHHDGRGILRGLPQPFEAMRYHSLAAEAVAPPLAVTAWTEDGVVMALVHDELPMFGVQFHPESILTPDGKRLLANFLEVVASCPSPR